MILLDLVILLLAAGPPVPPRAPPAVPDADSVRVVGRVVDASSRAGVEEARVVLVATGGGGPERVLWGGLTGREGSFVSAPVAGVVVELRVEALGFGPATTVLDLSAGEDLDVVVELGPEPLELDPVVVVSHRDPRLEAVGFYARRQAGQGYSLTREEIRARGAGRASDVFRHIPGVQMEAQRRGTASLLRYRGCYPDMILDGVPLAGPVVVDNILTVEQIEAVEVHGTGSMPARARVGTCGTVLVWTRQGSRTERGGGGMTVGRFLGVAAFVTLSILLTR